MTVIASSTVLPSVVSKEKVLEAPEACPTSLVFLQLNQDNL